MSMWIISSFVKMVKEQLFTKKLEKCVSHMIHVTQKTVSVQHAPFLGEGLYIHIFVVCVYIYVRVYMMVRILKTTHLMANSTCRNKIVRIPTIFDDKFFTCCMRQENNWWNHKCTMLVWNWNILEWNCTPWLRKKNLFLRNLMIAI